MGVFWTVGDVVAGFYFVAVLDEGRDSVGDDVFAGLAVFGVGGSYCYLDEVAFFGFTDGDGAADFGDDRAHFGFSRLEQLFNSRQALSDVAARDAACMKSSHRQLGAGFADRLSRYYSHCLADFNLSFVG